jgi:hypothetical protein
MCFSVCMIGDKNTLITGNGIHLLLFWNNNSLAFVQLYGLGLNHRHYLLTRKKNSSRSNPSKRCVSVQIVRLFYTWSLRLEIFF